MRRYSKKGLEKRKEERRGYIDFFEKHIEIIKKENKVCEECGEKLRGNVSEVAHILPKSYFKSISCNDSNVLYLCGLYSNNDCHNKYDNLPTEEIKKMKIFEKVSEVFKQLQEHITEKITYKHFDKYQK